MCSKCESIEAGELLLAVNEIGFSNEDNGDIDFHIGPGLRSL